MGCGSSSPTEIPSNNAPKLIPDNFKTLGEVQAALRKNGLEQSNLIIGIDCTKSNTWQGQRTFGGKSLHDVSATQTPYERVLQCIGATLAEFDDDKLIPLYGFGDAATSDYGVFNFRGSGVCYGFNEALQLYRQVIPRIQLSGPTSFAPIINEAVKVVQAEGGFHILLIIADGAVDEKQETIDAIVRAAEYALSIVVVGVGDGPWDLMEKFDNDIPKRKFDNLQFVNATEIFTNPRLEKPEVTFALRALMEIPQQYKYVKSQGMIKRAQRAGSSATQAVTTEAVPPFNPAASAPPSYQSI